jgi:periplasmic protein TonB
MPGIISGAVHFVIAAIALLIIAAGMHDAADYQVVYLVSGESGFVQNTPQVKAAAPKQKSVPVEEKVPVQAIASQVPAEILKKVEAVAAQSGPVRRAPPQATAGTGKTEPVSARTGPVSGQPVDVHFGDASGLNFAHREMPVYPFIARRMNKEARILLRLTISDRGKLLDVEVVEGAGYGFTEAAVDAVKKSSFVPARRGGTAITSRALLPVRFELTR